MTIGRRSLFAAPLVLAAAPSLENAWQFKAPSLDGGTLDFASLRDRVLLVVNTASFCGYTYQYEALEKLHRDLGPRGLTVVGIPSQDFNQESDSNEKVREFCELTYGVEFPMTEIAHVRGRDASPFYAWVRRVRAGWEPDWNFNKVLVGRDGLAAATFRSAVEPGSAALMQPIEAQLGRSVS